MQNLKMLPTLIFSATLLYACSGNSSASAAKDDTSATTTNTDNDSTYYGKNSVAYSIGERHVAIKDNLQIEKGKYIMALFLNTVKNTDDGMMKINFTNELTKEVFNFVVPNKGTTTVLKAKPTMASALNKKATEATYMGSYINYYGESVVVSITAVDDKHVAGTFSGKFSATDDRSKPPVDIRNGSFDLLFTKDDQ